MGTDDEPFMDLDDMKAQLAKERMTQFQSERVFKEHILGLKEKLIPSLRRVKVLEEQLISERSETHKVETELVKEIKDRKASDLKAKNQISALEGKLFTTERELKDMRLEMETIEDRIMVKARVEKAQAVAAQRRKWLAKLKVAELALFQERKEKATLETWLKRSALIFCPLRNLD
jgi:hypothetical protein